MLLDPSTAITTSTRSQGPVASGASRLMPVVDPLPAVPPPRPRPLESPLPRPKSPTPPGESSLPDAPAPALSKPFPSPEPAAPSPLSEEQRHVELPPLAQRHRYLHAGATILSYASLTRGQTTAQQAARAGRLARGGPIVFVGQEKVRSGFALVDGSPPREFVQGLPPGYRLVERHSFPGFAHHGVEVYVFARG